MKPEEYISTIQRVHAARIEDALRWVVEQEDSVEAIRLIEEWSPDKARALTSIWVDDTEAFRFALSFNSMYGSLKSTIEHAPHNYNNPS